MEQGLKAIPHLRIDTTLVIVLAEQTIGRAVEDISADKHSPIAFEVPSQAGSEKPVRPIEA